MKIGLIGLRGVEGLNFGAEQVTMFEVAKQKHPCRWRNVEIHAESTCLILVMRAM